MEPSLSEAKTPVSRLCLCSAPLARKRETQKFCLTPRLSLQLYYIPVLAPEVAGRRDRSGTGGPGAEGAGRGAGRRERRSGFPAGQGHSAPSHPLPRCWDHPPWEASWERPGGLLF